MKLVCMATVAASLLAAPAMAQVAINECDYQNPGTDRTEWIELVGAAGTNLTGWKIVLLNQGVEYNRFTLKGTIPNDFLSEWGGYGGFFVVGVFDAATAAVFGAPDYTPPGWSTNVIQNGPDDLIQLFDAKGNLIDEWQYDSATPGGPSFTGWSQAFDAYDSAGTDGNILTYSSIGRRGWSYDLPMFVFDLPHGIGSVANDPFDHETNSADFWAWTPRGPTYEAEGAEIFWSGTLQNGENRGITPGTFNHASYGTGSQDAYTINIVPEPGSLLLLGVGLATLIRRR